MCLTIVSFNTDTEKTISRTILFKGKRLKPEWSDNMPPRMTVVMTVKDGMTGEVFHQWLQPFARHKVAKNLLLVFDGSSNQHCKGGKSRGIIHYCLPSSMTQELQPFDKSRIKTLESFGEDTVQLFRNRNPEISY
jgi:hypothetical protein